MRSKIALSCLLATTALSVGTGCAPLPTVHPEFEQYSPGTIYVFDTENRTTRSIDQVKFGGLAQRLTGLRVFNFPVLVHVQIREALLSRGYEAISQAGEAAPDFSTGAIEEGKEPAFDAYLTSSIVSWNGSTQPPYRFDMKYKLQLVDARSGEVLYGGEFSIAKQVDRRTPADTRFIKDSIRRSVRKSMRLLPAAN